MPTMLNKVVVSTWDGAYTNTLEIVNSISSRNFTIIDSTDHGMFPNGIKSQNIFIKQIEASINSLNDEEYLTYISGDVSTVSWNKYIDQVEDIILNQKPWVYSPYLTFEEYPREFSSIGSLENMAGVDYGCITDGIVFTLHRDLALELLNFITYAKKTVGFQVGWGLDWIWCTLSIYENKAILRDSRISLLHPKSTSYDSTVALEEFRAIQELFLEFAKKENYDLAKIRKIQYSINERIKGNEKYFAFDKFYEESRQR
jgi:hypothetical protein